LNTGEGSAYASERREFARNLRKQTTRAEDILWERLRGSRFHGAKFRRQVPLDRFVVDFYCHAAKLVVELDGKQHEWFSDYDADGLKFSNASACASSGLRTPKSAMISIRRCRGFMRNCACPSTEARSPCATGLMVDILDRIHG
jgi:very-short-patch-repair endonuclease